MASQFTYNTPVLNDRQQSHGDFEKTARVSQALKNIIHTEIAGGLPNGMYEALDMICVKMARVVSGNPYEKDHWEDIAGYANLVSERLLVKPERGAE